MADPANAPGDAPTASAVAVRIESLRLSLPVDPSGAPKPDIEGARFTLTDDGLRATLEFASVILSRVSRERIDEFLGAMDQNPRLRPIRWYYASLLRLAGLRDELAISGQLIDGGVEVRARFNSADSGGLLRQLRDRARGLATVTVRFGLAAEHGDLRARVELSPDVNGIAAKLLLNTVSRRPGVTRIDDATVLIDLAQVIAAESDVPITLSGQIRSVDIAPTRAVLMIG